MKTFSPFHKPIYIMHVCNQTVKRMLPFVHHVLCNAEIDSQYSQYNSSDKECTNNWDVNIWFSESCLVPVTWFYPIIQCTLVVYTSIVYLLHNFSIDNFPMPYNFQSKKITVVKNSRLCKENYTFFEKYIPCFVFEIGVITDK